MLLVSMSMSVTVFVTMVVAAMRMAVTVMRMIECHNTNEVDDQSHRADY